jgi:predicted nucleic acid-binding protein
MFLLDTCVVSEGIKPAPDPAVNAWLKQRRDEEIYISVLTVGEIWFGIDQLETGRYRRGLERWFAEAVVKSFTGRTLPFDFDIAFRWGGLRTELPDGKMVDSQIAATAIVHDLTLVTRNVRDFIFKGLSVVNPWEA